MLLNKRGYQVSPALMAVKPEISLLSCQIRYEMMHIAGTTPRATDPAYHDKIVHDIVENLAVLEQNDLFESMFLYNRAGTCLFPNPEAGQKAGEVLRGALFGNWSGEELAHLDHLRSLLEELKGR